MCMLYVGLDGVTRTRRLPWESAEATEMKHRLDETYLKYFANEKQISFYRRSLDYGYIHSSRTIPENIPTWLRKDSSVDDRPIQEGQYCFGLNNNESNSGSDMIGKNSLIH